MILGLICLNLMLEFSVPKSIITAHVVALNHVENNDKPRLADLILIRLKEEFPGEDFHIAYGGADVSISPNTSHKWGAVYWGRILMGVDNNSGKFTLYRYGPKRPGEDEDDFHRGTRQYDVADPGSLDIIVKEVHCNMYFFQDMADQGIKHAKTFLGFIKPPLEEEQR